VRPGSEEYLHSEKYEIRPRDWSRTPNLDGDLTRINAIRRAHVALQRNDNLAFHPAQNEHLLCYSKRADPAAGALSRPALPGESAYADLLVIVNTDVTQPQETLVQVPTERFGIASADAYVVHDLLTGARYTWRGERNYVRLDPRVQPGHLFRIERP
jgi:starch synthase (maltosyl-transferring)